MLRPRPARRGEHAGYRDYLTAAQPTLMGRRRLRGRALQCVRVAIGHALQCVRAAIGHALAFSTWRSLTHHQALADGQAAALMSLLVAAAALAPVNRRAR